MDKIKFFMALLLLQLIEVNAFVLGSGGGPMPLWMAMAVFIPFTLCACLPFIMTCCAYCIDKFNGYRSSKEETLV